jgi:O-antigen ligase
MATLYLIRIHNIKWLYVFYIFSCIAILFIGSRTSFFGMILVAYLMTIYFSNNKKHFFKKTFVYLIILLILYLLSSVMNSDRVTQISIDDINDDIRLVTATYLYNYVISRNLWTGIGLGNENTYEVLGYVYDSDNMYIDILSQIGLFGLFVVLFLVIYTLLKIVKLKNKYVNSEKIFFPLSLIILNMSTSMTESIFDESFFYTSIGIAYIYINNLKRINSINMYKKL